MKLDLISFSFWGRGSRKLTETSFGIFTTWSLKGLQQWLRVTGSVQCLPHDSFILSFALLCRCTWKMFIIKHNMVWMCFCLFIHETTVLSQRNSFYIELTLWLFLGMEGKNPHLLKWSVPYHVSRKPVYHEGRFFFTGNQRWGKTLLNYLVWVFGSFV